MELIATCFHESQTNQKENNSDSHTKIKYLNHLSPKISRNHKEKHLAGINNWNSPSQPMHTVVEKDIEMVRERVLPFKQSTRYGTVGKKVAQKTFFANILDP